MAKKQTADARTLALIEQVKQKRQEISEAEKPNYKTNMSFRAFANSSPVNLHVESRISELVEIAAFLRSKESQLVSAANELGVDKHECEHDGYAIDDWIADIKTRLNKIQIKSKKDALAALEARLDKIISPELRAEMELAAIEAELQE